MAVEIEHKYLVRNQSYRDMASSADDICQGYLCRVPERTVRVRTRGGKGYITVKGKTDGDSRLEFEYEIPYGDAVEMLSLCEPPKLEKTRYLVEFGGHCWEVDEFHGKLQGLVTAEIELPVSETDYTLPPFVGENVTGDRRYYNSNL